MFRSIFLSFVFFAVVPLFAGTLTVQLDGGTDDVSFVGAIYRWDPDGLPMKADGKPRVAEERAVHPKIDEPRVDYKLQNKGGGKWSAEYVLPGTYDIIAIKKGVKQRFEGWRFAPVLDFETFFPPDAGVFCDKEVNGKKEKVQDEESLKLIDKQIQQSKHYENKVVPLYFGGSYRKGQIRPKQIRVLVMLIRDAGQTLDETSATMRFEIWQFEDRSGGYVKQKRTHVLERLIMPLNELRQWTWLWVPALSNINVEKTGTVNVNYTFPDTQNTELKGLKPY
jgi:hypothetical protein